MKLQVKLLIFNPVLLLLMLAPAGNYAFKKSSAVINREKQESNIKSIKIGTQTWMASNLNVDTFRNGDIIPNIENGDKWYKAGNNGLPAWKYYNNNPCNAKYGKMYNFFAVEDPRGLAPEGWRIPTKEDWSVLSKYLKSEAGNKLKSESGWANNGNGTNEYGFKAYPNGIIYYGGQCYDYGRYGFWWSSSTLLIEHGISFYIAHDSNEIFKTKAGKRAGLSVRCIKDE